MNLKKEHLETTEFVQTKAPYIMYKSLENTGFVHNAFSTKLGGVSEGIYKSMNFSVKMGDSPENVKKNFDIFLKENGFTNPVMTDQTHTVNVRKVTRADIGKGIYTDRDYNDVDGIITNEPGITLVTSYADCVPLYFVDVENKAIGLSHSGWRGTVGRIGKKTIEAMQKEYGTKPENVITAIGPSICANCYEVSEDVAAAFEKEFNCKVCEYENADRQAISQNTDNIVYSKKDGKYMLNLWAANYKVLTEAGIKEENISLPDICTCCNKDILFSHRGHNGKRGNLCAFLMIKNAHKSFWKGAKDGYTEYKCKY